MKAEVHDTLAEFGSGRAFRVKISSNSDGYHIVVRRIITTRSAPLFQLDTTQVMYSKKPGNSDALLIALQEPLTFLYIGTRLISFRVKFPLIEFKCQPESFRAWAQDRENNVYLINEGVVLHRSVGDPYYYYNYHSTMSEGRFRKIRYLTVGEEIFTLAYHPRPRDDFNRISALNQGPVSLVYMDGSREIIDISDFEEAMTTFGSIQGFESLDVIEQRTL